jgi:hypothetical protein
MGSELDVDTALLARATMTDQPPNPYASPQSDTALSAAGTDELADGQRIAFRGRVSRSAVRGALQPRASWVGVAMLLFGSCICLATGPVNILTASTPASTAGFDPLVQLLGIVGLGLLFAAIWGLLHALTPLGIWRNERKLLRQSPHVYDVEVSGRIAEEGIYLREDDGESWFHWLAMVFVQVRPSMIQITWGNGASGTTVLTRNMFGSGDEFSRAGRLLSDRVANPIDRRLVELNDFYLPAAALASAPAAVDTRATVEQRITYGQAIGPLLCQVPTAVVLGTTPLHVYFATLLSLSLLADSAALPTPAWIVGSWLALQLGMMLLSLYYARDLIALRRKRLMAMQWRFTDREVHVATTVGYQRNYLSDFQLRKANLREIILHQRATRMTSHLKRDKFLRDSDWSAATRIVRDNCTGAP